VSYSASHGETSALYLALKASVASSSVWKSPAKTL
jgi:hypothetical protein